MSKFHDDYALAMEELQRATRESKDANRVARECREARKAAQQRVDDLRSYAAEFNVDLNDDAHAEVNDEVNEVEHDVAQHRYESYEGRE